MISLKKTQIKKIEMHLINLKAFDSNKSDHVSDISEFEFEIHYHSKN